ncbi:hypothetical protein [Nocardia brasiliensis]|uniref:hypothetical protein n=1 Tax=Nocardia brasiliensis TaxID=37326 RepID=UPI002456E4B6|nr:hypothetical protein [Nocardia brasiliensis]
MPKESIQRASVIGDASFDVHWFPGAHVQIRSEREVAGVKHEVWSDTFTRQQLNHLIRVLRRARDQVHGKDE